MINLSSFNDLVPKSGRYAKDVTYIKVTDSMCQMVLGKGDYEQVVKYLGNTVNAKVSRDLGIIVLMKGADRRINSTSRRSTAMPSTASTSIAGGMRTRRVGRCTSLR